MKTTDIKAYMKEYQEANKERCNAYTRAWYERNKEERKAQMREYYAKKKLTTNTKQKQVSSSCVLGRKK